MQPRLNPAIHPSCIGSRRGGAGTVSCSASAGSTPALMLESLIEPRCRRARLFAAPTVRPSVCLSETARPLRSTTGVSPSLLLAAAGDRDTYTRGERHLAGARRRGTKCAHINEMIRSLARARPNDETLISQEALGLKSCLAMPPTAQGQGPMR